MRKYLVLVAVLTFGFLLTYGLTIAQEAKTETPEKAKAEKAEHGFIGVDGCKMCHKSEKKGNQFGKWSEGPHAKAFATLASDESKAIAKKAGIEGDPQKADACLKCHVTGHGAKAELLGKKFKVEDGVGCESCHGAGEDYKKKSVMESREASIAAGMIVPTEETCKGCHNEESPTYKEFDYEKALAQVAHPYPAEAAE
jgi:hypothetical protein